MELMQEVKGYSDSREEEEEEEAAEEIITIEESSSKHHYPFSSPSLSFSLSLSSSPSITKYTTSLSLHHDHHHDDDDLINIPHQQNSWLGMIHDQSPEANESHNSSSGLGLLHQQQDAAASNFINHTKQLDFMELSLGNNKDVSDEANFQQQGSGGAAIVPSPSPHVYAHHAASSSSSANHNNQPTEKEHMFDKVVTPSDVGKLNRLVIPKQHAEKYFPLDSSANEKGLLLNFEDRNGKLWRFRYSYWNSSQSYVMTKGWSRFVKEKKLDAGDIVSFQRGVGELYRHRLYIDWRRRPDHGPDPSTTLFTPFFLPNQPHLSQYSIRWGATSGLYSLPSPQAPRHHHDPLQQLNYNHMYPFRHQHHHHHGGGGGSHHYNNNYHELSSGSGSVYYLGSTPSLPMVDQSFTTRQQQQQEEGNNIAPMIIDSVPVVHHHQHQHQHPHGSSNTSSSSSNTSTAAKRLRLFGVNMECASSPSEDPKCCNLLSSTSVTHVTMPNSLPSSSSSLPSLQHLRTPREDTLSQSARFRDQRGEASMFFDLDPSLQYRQ